MDASEELIIAFCGGFSVGKTSLINLLLNQEFQLPVGIIPVTKVVTRIRYASHFQVWYEDGGERVCVEKAAASSLISGETALPENCTELVIGIPAEILKKGIIILDTPGYQEQEELEQVTRKAVQTADVAVLCCSAVEFGKHFEQNYMQELEESLGNFCLVVNYLDALHSEEDFQKLREYVDTVVAGRGSTALGRVQDKLVFYTVGAGKYAVLDGLDSFLVHLTNDMEPLKEFARIRKTGYDLRARLKETDDMIRTCRELRYREKKVVEKQYAQDRAVYREQCRNIEKMIDQAGNQGYEHLEHALSAIDIMFDYLDAQGIYSTFAKESERWIQLSMREVISYYDGWQQNSRVELSVEFASFQEAFCDMVSEYHVPNPIGGQTKECREAAKADIRTNLVPMLKEEIIRWLSAAAGKVMPPEPERDEKELLEIRETLNENIYLKDDLYTLLKTCEDEEAEWMEKYGHGITGK